MGTASLTISEPTQLTSAIGSFTNVLCFGQTNDGASMLVNGGTLIIHILGHQEFKHLQ